MQYALIVWKGNDSFAAFQVVEAQSGGYRIEPCSERFFRVVAPDAQPYPNKSFLHHVFCLFFIAQHFQGQREHHSLVGLYHPTERGLVAALTFCDYVAVYLHDFMLLSVKYTIKESKSRIVKQIFFMNAVPCNNIARKIKTLFSYGSWAGSISL